jgi:hypothetical protein
MNCDRMTIVTSEQSDEHSWSIKRYQLQDEHEKAYDDV